MGGLVQDKKEEKLTTTPAQKQDQATEGQPAVPAANRTELQSEVSSQQKNKEHRLALLQEQKDFLSKAVKNYSCDPSGMITASTNTQMHSWLKSAMGSTMGLSEADAQAKDVESMIKDFQRAHPPLRVDGKCGPRTMFMLMKALSESTEPFVATEYKPYYTLPPFLVEGDEQSLNDWLSQKDDEASGFSASYIPGVGETLESYSMEDATLENIPQGLKTELIAGAQKHGYSAETLLNAVNASCRKHKIPPIIALRIIQKESDFNPGCTSSAGAKGLMQLMPANCSELGVSDPFNIEQNIEGGVRHFAEYYQQQQNIPLTLAAYNAGPGNVRKYGGIPPFKETQNYVEKIMGRLSESLSGEELAKYKSQNDGTTIHQRYSWDCGPTAHANLFGELLGLDKDALAKRFREMQGSGGMSWANPARFKHVAEVLSGKKIDMVDLGNASPSELAAKLGQGWQISGSFNRIITKNGHITHLSGVTQGANGQLLFNNDDPNGKNAARGLSVLTSRQVETGGRQFWAFKVV